jgi:hypothetical protein
VTVLSRAAALVTVALVLAPLRATAGVGDELDLMAQLRSTNARERETAARTVAGRAARGDAVSILIAGDFAVTDDLRVRALLVDALAAAGAISPSARAFVPTASVLERRLRQQLANQPADRLPRGNQCSLIGAAARGVKLVCRPDPYCGDVGVVDRTFAITTGVRWEIAIDQRESESDRCARSPK